MTTTAVGHDAPTVALLARVDQHAAALADAVAAVAAVAQLGPCLPTFTRTKLVERRAVRRAWIAAADALDELLVELSVQLVHAEASRRGLT